MVCETCGRALAPGGSCATCAGTAQPAASWASPAPGGSHAHTGQAGPHAQPGPFGQSPYTPPMYAQPTQPTQPTPYAPAGPYAPATTSGPPTWRSALNSPVGRSIAVLILVAVGALFLGRMGPATAKDINVGDCVRASGKNQFISVPCTESNIGKVVTKVHDGRACPPFAESYLEPDDPDEPVFCIDEVAAT